MKYAYIAEQDRSGTHRVSRMCAWLEVSRSGYYKWRGREPRARAEQEMKLRVHIRAIHRQSRESYGSPRVWRELKAQGIAASRGKVEQVMREEGLRGKSNRRGRKRKPAEEMEMVPAAENVLQRRFGVEEIGGADRVWASDITYVPTRQGWLYLAVVLDVGTRRVVGWSMGASQVSELPLDALEMAVRARGAPAGLLHHSDRGSQYTSRMYQERLARYGMRRSMSRKGNCWDNAVVESFFATMESELIAGADWHTHEEAKRDLFEYVEIWYNRKRRHSSLGYLSPLEYERRLGERPRGATLPDAA